MKRVLSETDRNGRHVINFLHWPLLCHVRYKSIKWCAHSTLGYFTRHSGIYLFWRLECWRAAHKLSICSPFAAFYTPNIHTEERAGPFQKTCVYVFLSVLFCPPPTLSGKHLLWFMSSACEMFYFGMASRGNHSPIWLKTFLISQHSWRPCMLVLVLCEIQYSRNQWDASRPKHNANALGLSVLAGYNATSITAIVTGWKLAAKHQHLAYYYICETETYSSNKV